MPKAGRGRRIFKGVFLVAKWLWVILLAAAFVCALYFQAHWKLAALLTVLILTPTIIPKRLRRYVYLGFGFIMLALALWVCLPEDSEGWQPYVFKDQVAALEAKLYVPDEVNAALVYNRLMAGYDHEASYQISQCLPEDASAEARNFLKFQAVAGPGADLSHTIAVLLEAASSNGCRFPLAHNVFQLTEQLNRLKAFRMWARMLLESGEQDLADQKTEEGILKFLAVLRMADHLYRQPAPLDVLSAMAIEGLAIAALNKSVMTHADMDAGRLRNLDTMLASGGFNWQADFPRVLDSERLYAKHTAVFPYAMNPKGRIRRASPDTSSWPALEATYSPRTPVHKLLAIVTWFGWPPPQDISRIVDENFAPCYKLADPNYASSSVPPPSATRFSLQVELKPAPITYHNLFKIHRRTSGARHGARILTRLHRHFLVHGGYPQSLDEVLTENDFLSASHDRSAFVYRREGDGFVLYHTGVNGTDDGGVMNPSAGADDVMIWPVRR